MDKELFNPKTIDRFCSSTFISSSQRKSANEWLSLLEKGELKREKANYMKFADIVLVELLGYERKYIKFEEGFIEFSYNNKSGRTVLGIEAKGGKTKDLFAEQKGYREAQKTPIDQLWNYMGKLNLDYGIATNYRHFVLLDRSRGSSTFHFFDFVEIKNNEQKLKEFIAIFSKKQIIDNNFIEILEKESAIEEKNFTKEFYKLFHETRLMLIREFQDNGISRGEAVHFAQLFLNRLMFIFFAEDTEKIERRLFENLIISALESHTLIHEQSRLISSTILGLFRSLDRGSSIPRRVFGFNGGLFKEEISPNIYFNDFRSDSFFKDIFQFSKLKKQPELDPISKPIFERYQNKLNPIIKNLLVLASFDFKSEVNVNILGHIFEQSLSDLEELKEGKLSKRKKEGIYYTPEYITDYICRNTIIPHLSKKNSKTPRELVIEFQNNIKELEDRFKSIKILDPACGSGAFLIKAVDVLLEIHKEIQLFKESKGDYTAIKRGRKYKKDENQLTLIKWVEEDEAREIIENNIFGVDINEESTDITKLSLFLKIAKKNKKLIDLSKNIRFGNSLIDDKEIDPKAFDWKQEFSDVLGNGKFDIIIGNPPYVSQKGTVDAPNIDYNERKYYRENYQTLSQNLLSTRGGVKLNLFALWIERGINLLKDKGFLSLIVHKNLLKVESYKFLRKYILDNVSIIEISDLGSDVFENVTGETIILNIKNQKLPDNKVTVKEWSENERPVERQISQKTFNETLDNMFNIYHDSSINKLKKKMLLDSVSLEDAYKIISFGLNTKDNKKYFSTERHTNEWKKSVMGRNVSKWAISSHGYVYYNDRVLTRKGDIDAFEAGEKIILQRIGSELIGAFDSEQMYCYNSTNMILKRSENFHLKYLLCLLNSRLMNYYYTNVFSMKSKLTVNITQGYLSQIPVKDLSIKQQKPFIEIADNIIRLSKSFYNKRKIFLNRLKQHFTITINKKLIRFYDYSFGLFYSELKKQKVLLSLEKQDEWEKYFNKYKDDIQGTLIEISKKEEEMNKMVYEIYRISDKEVSIIEGN